MAHQAYVADLLKHIMDDNDEGIVGWLCHVRDLDMGSVNRVVKISKACDAVIQTLIRFFTARYITRSAESVEAFKDLLVAAVDLSVDASRRWQRVCNMCCFLAVNARKERTIHVYPPLKSAILELDEDDPIQCQEPFTPTCVKALESYVHALRDTLVEHVATAVGTWLDADPLRVQTSRTDIMLLESFLTMRRIKECHRLITHIVINGQRYATTRFDDVFRVLWNVLNVVINSFTMEVDPIVKKYVQCCETIFFCLYPSTRAARVSRLSLLYYAYLVVCKNKVRDVSDPQNRCISKIVNLPTTMSSDMQYLTIFPRI